MVDVRPAPQFNLSHIEGARSVPAAEIQSADLPHTGPIIVYCTEGVCPLSNDSAQALIAKGYQNVSILDGGFAQWQKLGYPVEKAAPGAAPMTTMRTADETQTLLANGQALALDVRPASEYAAGHLHAAQNIPLENLAAGLNQLPKGREIIVYDRQSTRSKKAVFLLTGAGLNATELAGGVAAWTSKKNRTWEVK